MRKPLSWLLFLISVTSTELSSLNGKHQVIGLQLLVHEFNLHLTRNASGHIVEIRSVAADALDALSKHLNFTYSILQVYDTRLDKQSDAQPGLAYYMDKGKCDLVIGLVVMTPRRLAVMDFAEGFAYTPVVLLIPMPESPNQGIAVVSKPFQATVWLGLLISMPILALTIYIFIRPVSSLIFSKLPMDRPRNGTAIKKTGHFLFQISQILLNQGVYFPRMQNAVYFVLGSWCLCASVLVCAYNSLLVSYVLGSNTAEPLVDSVRDLAQNSNINLAVDKGYSADVYVSEATHGVNKLLGDKLRSDPKSRCVKRQECVDLVKSGTYVYLNGLYVTLSAIDEDYKATGKCSLALARKTDPVPGSYAWVLPKKSPYTKLFIKGFMELHSAGLIDLWAKRELNKYKDVDKCLNEARQRQHRKVSGNRTQISLKNIAGAFYVLIVGYFISFVFFVFENCYHRLSMFQMKKSKHNAKQNRNTNQNTTDKNVNRAIFEHGQTFAQLLNLENVDNENIKESPSSSSNVVIPQAELLCVTKKTVLTPDFSFECEELMLLKP